MLWGDKFLSIEGALTFEDLANELKAVIIFNKHKRFDQFSGKLYRFDFSKTSKKEPQKVSEIKDLREEICNIEGSWLNNLVIDGEEFWNVEKIRPM